ncbi:MAG: pinR [Bryobacterales bacterium]|nr:pinR [Bryobacterales bacterium]
MRCAIYARYSSDLQRESSIEDQIRKCRKYAENNGWTVLDEFIAADRAMSAAGTAGRDGLQTLIASAREIPTPFDCILVDDTSRLARNLEDALRTVKILEFHNVAVCAISQNLNSADKSSRSLLTLYGMMDEQFLESLREKVHRGQEGQVLRGLQAGGRCYGYRNVPIEDPMKVGKYNRPAVLGVRLEIDEAQANVVRRIFDMYGSGLGLAHIAKTLNGEGVVSPQTPRTRAVRSWCTSSLFELLRNERYRGRSIWNKTQKKRNPETGKKITRPRPQHEWVRAEVPEWRIVADEQWDGVRARIDKVGGGLPPSVLGGMNRTQQSRMYLFSGLLRCGDCGSRMVIVSGSGKRGYVKYGCPSHRYRGTCVNAMTIRRDRLESQLLGCLNDRVLCPEMVEYAVQSFERALKDRVLKQQRAELTTDKTCLERQRHELRAQAARISEAIARGGDMESLLDHLKTLEAKLRAVSKRIDACNPFDFAVSSVAIRNTVLKGVQDLKQTLRSPDVSVVRTTLQRHVLELVLTRGLHEGRRVYFVAGKVQPVAEIEDLKSVMGVVARDGIEPPTRGFSVRCSTS